jgi:hypothetical protein
MKFDYVCNNNRMCNASSTVLSRRVLSITRYMVTCLLAILVMSPISPARATEIAPFAGQRFGGSFVDANTGTTFEFADDAAFGVILDFYSKPREQIEVYLSRQDTRLTTGGTFTGDPLFDLTIDYYHIGGLVMFGDDERIRPFMTGTFGLTQMDPDRADLTTENRPSIALGGGSKIYLTRRIGLRVDVRGIYTSLNSNSAIFCSGGCAVKVQSSGFVQTEISAALMLSF